MPQCEEVGSSTLTATEEALDEKEGAALRDVVKQSTGQSFTANTIRYAIITLPLHCSFYKRITPFLVLY